MESRMEKYYEDDLSNFTRSKRNEDLYKNVYKEISDLENLPIPDNSNEIDMDGLKQIISSREEYKKSKELERTMNLSRNEIETAKKNEKKVYDINVMLESAKNEINRTNNYREKIVNNNFLTSLEDANIPPSDDAMEISIPMNSGKNKNDDSLPLDILADLKGSDNTIVTDPIIKEEVTMINKIKEGETFYSGSFNFSKKDFDEEEEEEDFLEKKDHSGIRIFFLIFGLLLLAGAICLLFIKYVL